ncbi:protein FAM117B-like isoform X2 [Lineus longissimus]|uniref:protein FAM117B-like isoform X2 n=1 Tax=Lineus longissimus TaxID=88925 RepID=UPI00315C65F9
MSNNSTQRVRRNASPASSSKQGPMKATLQFSLMQGSPTRTNGKKGSPSSSPTPSRGTDRVKPRRSPDSRASPERRSPSSPGIKVERPKAIRSSPSPAIRRTGSLDAIAGPYLTGQWPRESMFSQPGMTDKSTQTPEEWDEADKDKKKKHKRSASVGNGDQQLAALTVYRQMLQRKKDGSKQCVTSSQRQSPIQGNHSAIHPTPPLHTISKAIVIPGTHIPKVVIPRIRGSYEGLNEEIEKLVLRNHPGPEGEERQVQEPTPDGHRAPVLELIRGSSTRSVDTQTPSGYIEHDSGNSSRSQSISPTFPIIPAGSMDTSRPSSRSESSDSTSRESETQGELKIVKSRKEAELEASACSVPQEEEETESPEPQTLPKNTISPRPNKSYSFVREPPDGCEKVNIISEPKAPPVLKEPLLSCPQQSEFVLKPSAQSAFYPFYTKLYGQEIAMKAPVTPAALPSIESQ